jgi:protease I
MGIVQIAETGPGDWSPERRSGMARETLQGLRVAILAADGFELAELLEPKIALDNAGAATFIVAPSETKIRGWNDRKDRVELPVDIPLKSAKAEDFHALLLPGGATNPDRLQMSGRAIQFVKDFMDLGKPVAAISDGARTILEAGALRGRTMTSWPSLKTDCEHAGAKWINREVVCDGKLITSRNPSDIPAFDREMMRVFTEERNLSTEIRRMYP